MLLPSCLACVSCRPGTGPGILPAALSSSSLPPALLPTPLPERLLSVCLTCIVSLKWRCECLPLSSEDGNEIIALKCLVHNRYLINVSSFYSNVVSLNFPARHYAKSDLRNFPGYFLMPYPLLPKLCSLKWPHQCVQLDSFINVPATAPRPQLPPASLDL